MTHPKTTILGVLMLVAAGSTFLAHTLAKVFAGDWLGAVAAAQAEWQSLLTALAGLGLIHAADGGK